MSGPKLSPRGRVTLLLFLFFPLISGCAGNRSHYNSSVMDYLYPHGNTTVTEAKKPQLQLPLAVGIAFVPGSTGISEEQKNRLLDDVANAFRHYDFVDRVELVNALYLQHRGGFDNLNRVARMHGLDVMALVSFDQTQFTDENLLAFTYWSVIGAYVVRGEKNDTRTMLDTAVFDMNSNRMLFRAPGVSAVKGRATPVNLSEALREDSLEGFQRAADDMTVNLQQQLRQFTQRLRDNPDSADIQYRPGYAGGAGHWLLLVAGLVLAGMRSAQSWRMGRPGWPHSTWNFLPRGLSTRSKVCAPK